MNNWHPHALCSCSDSVFVGWITAVLSLGVVAWYAMITRRWWNAAMSGGDGGQKIWGWLVVVFVVCAIAGYGTTALAMWFPRTAVVFRLALLAIQNIACPVFLIYASQKQFTTISQNETVGRMLTEAVNDFESLSDKELASLARRSIAAACQRYSGGLRCG